ncbi:MAG: hypothetical protein KTQ49_06735 [Candidatus Omnitrophica bacterium]|nr:hypothetical protein [Candidatus Omnitrophota bacterium]
MGRLRTGSAWLIGVGLAFFSGCLASPGNAEEALEQEGSIAQAQETLHALFGSRSALPVPPRFEGSIALPGFDSKDMRLGETDLREEKTS